VDGSLGIIETAFHELEEKKVVKFSDDDKSEMVINLMTILCSDKQERGRP
jgi:hypothetical protein